MDHNFESNFFTLLELLDDPSRRDIEAVCHRVAIPAKEVIYDQGDAANTVYIVESGVVEVHTESPDGQESPLIGYMGRGDFFGDLAVLTGHARLVSVHACEDVKLLWIEKPVFLQLLEKIPRMGSFFSRNLARRLHQTSTEAHLSVYSIDLAGNLRHFNLLNVFQAISGMGHSGELYLNNSAHELIGSFFFRDGRAEQARFVHLDGLEAVWQGFIQSGTDGTFTFRVGDEPVLPFTDENRIELGTADLLAKGAEIREMYRGFSEPLRRMEGSLGRGSDALPWTDEKSGELAQRIRELIATRPQPLTSLWRRVNYSSATFLEAVSRMIAAGEAELLPASAAEEKRIP